MITGGQALRRLVSLALAAPILLSGCGVSPEPDPQPLPAFAPSPPPSASPSLPSAGTVPDVPPP